MSDEIRCKIETTYRVVLVDTLPWYGYTRLESVQSLKYRNHTFANNRTNKACSHKGYGRKESHDVEMDVR